MPPPGARRSPSRPALLAAAALAATACAARPARLGTLQALDGALRAGRDVRAVISYAGCTGAPDPAGGPGPAGPEVVGGTVIDRFEWFGAGTAGNARPYLAASATQLVSHPRHGPVLNYVRLRFQEDGTVEVTARYLRPPALEVLMDQTWRCPLSPAPGQGAVALFAR